MGKKILAFILTFGMLIQLMPVIAFAEIKAMSYETEGVLNENISWKVDENGVLVISGSGDMPSVSMNGEISWRKAWQENPDIKAIRIEEGITSIGSYNFNFMNSVSAVIIASDVQKIGEGAFYSSSIGYMDEIVIPSNVKTIEKRAFESSRLTFVVLEQGIENLGERCFENSGLSSVSLPESIKTIGDYCFNQCHQLKSVTMPDSVETIGKALFENCENLESVKLPAGMQSIPKKMFYNCYALSEITITVNVSVIGENAFYDCRSLEKIILPEKAEVIENAAFSYCSSLYEISLPENVKSIGNYAFSNTSIEEITIPNAVTSMGEGVFASCDFLKSVSLPENQTKISSFMFEECISLEEFKFNDTVEEIGKRAFYNCEALQTIAFPSSLHTIGEEAFSGCGSIKEILIPNSLTTLGDKAFYNCDGIEAMVIPSSIKSIPTQAFALSSSLKEVKISEGVEEIQQSAFLQCSKLSSVSLPESVTSIGYGAFSSCYDLNQIVLPSQLKTIETRLFYDCEDLQSIIIPEGVTEIKEKAFYYCADLTSVTIPESVTAMAADVFSGCSIGEEHGENELILYIKEGSYAEEYAITKGIKYLYEQAAKITLTVTDGENPITEGYTVYWYEEGKENAVAEGSTLLGAKKDVNYTYKIVLGENLSYTYMQPEAFSVTGTNEDIELSCTLKKIPVVSVIGKTEDEENNAVISTVKVIQSFGTYEKETDFKADEEGAFSMEIACVPTQIIISAAGYYTEEFVFTAEELTNEKALGTIILEILSSNKIELLLTQESAARPGEAKVTKNIISFDDISFTVKNKTKDTVIENYTAAYPYIVFDENEVLPTDVIEITATDRKGAKKAETVITSLSDEKASICFLENGKIEAVRVTGNDENLVMIFDENGIYKASYTVKGGFMSAAMPSGNYRLVWMKKTKLLLRTDKMENLSSYGLAEGEDYIVKTCEVQNGIISVLEDIAVPVLDESKLYYTDEENTSMKVNAVELSVGDYITMRAAYDIFSKHKSSEEKVQIHIPAGLQVVEGSVSVNGSVVPYTMENNILSVKTEERVGVVRLYAVATTAGMYAVSASVCFTAGEADICQPIGSAVFTAQNAKITVPETTVTKKITVTGKTRANSTVHLYADGKLTETVTANQRGTYEAEITLENTYYYSYHDIYAEIENEAFGKITTETKSVLYNTHGTQVSSVTMYHNGQQYVFDFRDTEDKEFYYWNNPYFTFVVEFEGQKDLAQNVVLNVFDMQGNVHSLIANYDSIKEIWMASGEFSSFEAPVNVGVEYDVKASEEKEEYSATAHPLAAENNKAFVSAWDEAYEEILTAEIKAEDENSITLEMSFKDNQEAAFDVIVEEIAYESFTVSDMEANGFTKVNADNTEEKPIYTKWELKDGKLIYTLVDTQLLYAYQYTVPFSDVLITEGFSQKTLMNYENTDALSRAVWDVLENFPIGSVPETAAITDFYQLIKLGDEKYSDAQNRMTHIANLISARCGDTGKLLLSEGEIKAFITRMEQLQITLDSTKDRLDGELALYKNKINNSGIFNLLTLGVGKIVSSSGKTLQTLKNSKNAKYTKYIVRSAELREKINVTAGGVWDLVTNLSQYIEGPIGDFFSYFDVSGSSYWISAKEAYNEWDVLCTMLENDIFASYDACGDKNFGKEDKKKDPAPDKNPVIDPSGYVYEAVPSNRLEGVKAEIYTYDYPLDKNGKPEKEKENILWEAENFDQLNPIYTDVNGRFRWDVPQGQWLVKFTKSGYTATDSSQLAMAEDGYLPVPPPQTEVNVGMVSKSAPTVESVEAYKDGVIIFFSQYMNIKSVEKAVSVVYNGKEIEGKAGPINAEYDYEGEERYASQFVFVPETTLKGTIIVTVTDKAENYAGKELKNDSTVTTKIVNEPTAIKTEEEVKVTYNSGALFTVSVTPAKAGANRTLLIESNASDIVGVITHEVTTDDEGDATVMLEGMLPGTTTVKISVIGSLLSEEVEVTVLPVTDNSNTCARVTASVDTGEEVEKGTKVYLSTETEDATIYYTLDGTCPCDTENKARKKYTKALTINEDTLLIAYAVKEGMNDSPTAGFAYRVEQEYERVEKPTASPVGGKVASGTTVKLSCKTKNATIYYTTNGSTPTEASKVYTSAIKITKTTTIKAIAVKEGMRTSAVMIENYTVKAEEKPVGGGGGGGATGGTIVGGAAQPPTTPPAQTPQTPADTYVPTGNELYNFRDVTKDQWFYAPIKYAVDKKLFSGISDTEFAPNNLITRAMMVTVLHRADNSPAAQYAITYYDVELNAYYTPAVRWATAASIVKGYSVTEFGTNDNITREQIAAIVYRYAQYKGYDTSAVKDTKLGSYSDASEVSDYAVAAMQYCVGLGLMKGKTETTLNPKDNATRAEIAAILQRMIENNKAE